MARVEAEERDRERGREGPELIRDPKLIDEFEKGEQLRCQDIPLEVFRRGVAVMIEGSYWGARASVAGILQDIHVRGPADIEVSLRLQGTDEENLLRWSTAWMTGSSCKNLVDSANLLESLHVR